MQIKSFEEAGLALSDIERSVQEIRSFLQMADETISAVNMLKGQTKKVSAAMPAALPRTSEHRNGDVPESWAARVVKMFREAGQTMTVQQAIKKYELLGWPRPENKRALFKGIYGAMHYLTNRKHILVKDGEVYRLNEML